jgi:hypothetical protein
MRFGTAGQGALARWIRRGAALGGLLGLLTGCLRLDTEAEVRALLKTWVFLAQTREFTSKGSCTAAIFDTVSPSLRGSGAVWTVTDVRSGLRRVEQGQAVAFDLPGISPNEVSEQVMSISLSDGLGLISSFVGPAQACMGDQFQSDVYLALMSPDTVMIYDPTQNALLLLHRPSQIAFFLRGNV